MVRRKRYYRRRREPTIREIIGGLFVLLCVGGLYSIYTWYQENTILFWGIIALAVVISVLSFCYIKGWEVWKRRRAVANMPEKVKSIKMLLDTFATDIPKFSKHSESLYQTDFGRYLKEHLLDSVVVYEETKGGARPDIVIDKTIAIEIKALQNPNTQKNREYNRKHVDSIFKKIHTYKVYDTVIVIIFNIDYIKDKNWKDYEKMKEAVQQENVILFEK